VDINIKIKKIETETGCILPKDLLQFYLKGENNSFIHANFSNGVSEYPECRQINLLENELEKFESIWDWYSRSGLNEDISFPIGRNPKQLFTLYNQGGYMYVIDLDKERNGEVLFVQYNDSSDWSVSKIAGSFEEFIGFLLQADSLVEIRPQLWTLDSQLYAISYRGIKSNLNPMLKKVFKSGEKEVSGLFALILKSYYGNDIVFSSSFPRYRIEDLYKGKKVQRKKIEILIMDLKNWSDEIVRDFKSELKICKMMNINPTEKQKKITDQGYDLPSNSIVEAYK